MDLKQYYEKTYQGVDLTRQQQASESLAEFFRLVADKYEFKNSPPRKTLEIGSGLGGMIPLFLENCCWPTCLDFSAEAIKASKSRVYSAPVEFVCENIVSFCRVNEYEFIFDSHLIHCLTIDTERQKALLNIYNSLQSGGLFALECMVRTKETQVEKDFYLDEQGVFWQVLEETVVPTRKICTAMELEQQILSYGFEIDYLMVHSEKKFIPHNRRDSVLKCECFHSSSGVAHSRKS